MSTPVVVGNYFDRFTAEADQSFLESNGITSYVSADDGGGMRASLLTGSGGALLIVAAEDAEQAKEILLSEPLDENFDESQLVPPEDVRE